MTEATNGALKLGAVLAAPLEEFRMGYHRFRVPPLAMACALRSRDLGNAGGIPYSEVSGEEAIGSWIGVGAFAGDAAPLIESDAPGDVGQLALAGTCAVTLTGDRLLGIVDGDEEAKRLLGLDWDGPSNASIWFAAARGAIELETKGEQGIFTKRPAVIRISANDWDVHIRQVYELSKACTSDVAHRRNSAQGRGENSLIESLK